MEHLRAGNATLTCATTAASVSRGGAEMRDPQVRLTEEEQRRLAALEAALCEEDPRLARRLRSARRIPVLGVVLASAPPARGTYGLLLLALGAVVTIATFTWMIAVAVVGCVLMAAGAYAALSSPALQASLRRIDSWLGSRSRAARSDS